MKDEKTKVVELENEIDDQCSLLESTTNAQKSYGQETHYNSICWQAISR